MTGFTRSAAVRLARRFHRRRAAARPRSNTRMIAAGIGVTIASTVWGLGSALKETWYDKIGSIF